MVKIYGIKNCDTMKKAFRWLEERGVAYDFHDYKKQGADEAALRAAIDAHGWESVINKRGTTWRKLPDEVKAAMDENGAVQAALDNPSMIKRPLLFYQDGYVLGFSEGTYKDLF